MYIHTVFGAIWKKQITYKEKAFYHFSMDVGNKPPLLLHVHAHSNKLKFSIVERLKLHSTFISGISKMIICRTWTFFTTFVRDGKKWGWRYWLGTAAVVTTPVCSTRRLGINAASTTTTLNQRRWCTMPIRNILRLLKIKGIRWLLLSG